MRLKKEFRVCLTAFARRVGRYTARIRSMSTLDCNGPLRIHYYRRCNQGFLGGHPSQYCSGSSTLNLQCLKHPNNLKIHGIWVAKVGRNVLHIDPRQVGGGHLQVGGILTVDITPRFIACSTVLHEFRWLTPNVMLIYYGGITPKRRTRRHEVIANHGPLVVA